MPESQTAPASVFTLDMLREAIAKLREEQPEHTVVTSMEDYERVADAIVQLELGHVRVIRHPSITQGTALFFRDNPTTFSMENWSWTDDSDGTPLSRITNFTL